MRGPSDGRRYIAGQIAIQGNAIAPNPYVRPLVDAHWRGLRSKIQNLIIENWGSNAISIAGDGSKAGGGSEVSGCIIRNIGSEGILAFGDGNAIHDNRISNTLGWAIDLQGSYNRISKNQLTNVSNSVGYYGGQDTGGIVLNGDLWPGGCHSNVIEENILDGGTNPGIVVIGSLNYPVSGTMIRGNSVSNMGSNTSPDSAAIVVVDNGRQGAISDTVVTENLVQNSGVKGIQVWNTLRTTISTNVIDKSAGNSIEALSHGEGTARTVTVSGNTIKGMRKNANGIVILGVQQATVSANIISNVMDKPTAVYAGIAIGGNTKDYLASDNRIQLETDHGHGFYVTNTASHGSLTRNIISNCSVGLFYDSLGDYLDITENDLSNGNTTALSIRGNNAHVSRERNIGNSPD
jgi:hypothetical protein